MAGVQPVLRAFIAINITPETIAKIGEAVAELKGSLAAVRWVNPGNIHLTLKFLGDIDDSQVESIEAALARQLQPFPRFTIHAKGLGVFPGTRRPRVLWVGLDQPRLVELAATVEAALVPLGFAPEQRGFQPHLTIGRFRQFNDTAKQLAEELERWKNYPFGVSEVDEVTLFQSVLRPGGALHTPLKVIALADR
jgi:2'-5' RNA ligase